MGDQFLCLFFTTLFVFFSRMMKLDSIFPLNLFKTNEGEEEKEKKKRDEAEEEVDTFCNEWDDSSWTFCSRDLLRDDWSFSSRDDNSWTFSSRNGSWTFSSSRDNSSIFCSSRDNLLNQTVITPGSWVKGEFLGCGSFGTVHEAVTEQGLFFAVKQVSLDQEIRGKQSVAQVKHEIELLSQLEHDNIVRYIGTETDESYLYIFTELAAKGSLLSLYRKQKLRDSQVSAYTRQILHGLKYLYDRNIVHRDIKCANILVLANGSIKIADFGLAKAIKQNDVKSCHGTAFWMAPEVINGKFNGYGFPADIWSLGCTVLEMLTGQVPYHSLEWISAMFKIGQGELPLVPDSLSIDARDFILQCLKVNPNNRPTAAKLLDHKFVQRSSSQSSGSASQHIPRRG